MLSSVYAPKDFKRLRAAGDVVARCFDYISPYIRAGISTGEIDRMVAEFLKENGARSSDLGYMGYPKHICTSVNDVIVHGIPSDEVILKDGDIVNVDLTAEYKGFHGGAGMNTNKNMNSVLKQAQKMQEDMERIQSELEEKTVQSTAGGGMIEVVATGKKEIVSIKIKPEVVDADDVETLEDLILVAVNDAIKKADDMMAEGMSSITGGLNIPGLF